MFLPVISGCLQTGNQSVIGSNQEISEFSNGASDRAFKELPETADYSQRIAYFSSLSTHELCTLALVIEAEPLGYTDYTESLVTSRVPFFATQLPNSRVGLETRLGTLRVTSQSNRNLAMLELSNRIKPVNENLCSAAIENGTAIRDNNYRFNCSDFKISPDAICSGTYGGKSFSEAMIDIAILRKQFDQNAQQRRDSWTPVRHSNSTTLRCTSTSMLDTVSTTCF